MVKIAVDVMGFENDPKEAINAAIEFAKFNKDLKIIFVGDQKIITKNLPKNIKQFEIKHTTDFIKMDDLPIAGLRKINSSMAVALKMIKANEVDAMVTAGSTSCFVPNVYHYLGLINGIKKFAFMPWIPTINRKGVYLLDCGANPICNGLDLYNFALMANLYCKIVNNIDNPKIGLLNIGTEKHKGLDYHHEANKLLKADREVNYIGFFEPNHLLTGEADVVVSDGYSGNLVLKASEGSLKTIGHILKDKYKKPWNWIGAMTSLPIIKAVLSTFDYRNNAAAIVLGANGIAIKTHGSADQKQFASAIRVAYKCVKNNFLDKLKKVYNDK